MADSSGDRVVVLHQFKPYAGVPNLSAPCLKLETYLRMVKIPYKTDNCLKMSKKGKMPWIEFQGKEIADSNFIIEFLNEEFKVDLDKDLTPQEKAASFGLRRMVEENTYWTLVYYRWVENFAKTKRDLKFVPWRIPNSLALRHVQSNMKTALHNQGTGRHSRDEIFHIAHDDLRALSMYLGDKEFMMGDKATSLDASVFGTVSMFLWADLESPQHKMIKENFANLEKLCVRIKQDFWPDWDEAIKCKD